jgi:hypothetical protein
LDTIVDRCCGFPAVLSRQGNRKQPNRRKLKAPQYWIEALMGIDDLKEADAANGSVITDKRSKDACPGVNQREEMHQAPEEQAFRGRQSRMYLPGRKAQDATGSRIRNDRHMVYHPVRLSCQISRLCDR